MIKRVVPWLVLALVLFMIYKAPVGMAHVFVGLFNGVLDVADRLGTFVSNL